MGMDEAERLAAEGAENVRRAIAASAVRDLLFPICEGLLLEAGGDASQLAFLFLILAIEAQSQAFGAEHVPGWLRVSADSFEGELGRKPS